MISQINLHHLFLVARYGEKWHYRVIKETSIILKAFDADNKITLKMTHNIQVTTK